MARYWLTLLDDVLTWLNPILGCAAAMLVLLVLQAADEHFSGKRINPVAPAIVPEKIASAVERRDANPPPERQELRFYD